MKSFLTVEKLQFRLFKSEISHRSKTGHGGPGKCLQAGCALDDSKAVSSKSLRSLRHHLGNLLFR